ncbi:MAG: 23S rRNA (uracil1939-C5)-methyltransferase [Lysobacterales bacterium]|jgi:23S rRNA (uracil1939-C5)-methyltransferase
MARRKKLSPDPFKIEIQSLLENGRGSTVYESKNLQVYGALAGESVMARHMFGRKMRNQAETLEVLKPSTQRVEPRCPHFGTCSACTLQHLDYAAQLQFKQKTLLSNLQQQGNVRPEQVLPPLSAGQWNYRRKARMSVRYVKAKERVLVGFRERDGRFVADMGECHTLIARVADRLPEIIALIESLDAIETIPQIEVTSGDDASALIFRHLEPLSEVDIAALKNFARKTGLAVLLQPKGPETVHALEPAKPALNYALPDYDVDFEFEPLDFVQVNGPLNQLMIKQALQLLDLQPQDRVLDLFCGLGNFTLPIARSCKAVTGVEGDETLVQRAIHNANRNGISNAGFIQVDLYSQTAGLVNVPGMFDKVLIDPPRSGAEQVLPIIASSAATKVVYVSCNPETLGRDAGILVHQHGFRLSAAGMMDMFPHTSHIESMALFEREMPGKTPT